MFENAVPKSNIFVSSIFYACLIDFDHPAFLKAMLQRPNAQVSSFKSHYAVDRKDSSCKQRANTVTQCFGSIDVFLYSLALSRPPTPLTCSTCSLQKEVIRVNRGACQLGHGIHFEAPRKNVEVSDSEESIRVNSTFPQPRTHECSHVVEFRDTRLLSAYSSYSSGMFSGAQNLAVTGNTLINTTNNYTTVATVPSDVRMVPLSDIDLQHEIHLDDSTGVVDRHRIQLSGRGAEEIWGAASSGSIRATLFHDVRHIDSSKDAEFGDVRNYFRSNFQLRLEDKDCTFWMRHSTGRLCADLVEPITIMWFYDFWRETNTQRVPSWNALNGEGMIIKSLTLQKYHKICAYHLDQYRVTTISRPVQVNLGTVVFWPSTNRFEDSVGIAFYSNAYASPRQWEATAGARGARMEKGWMRSSDVFDSTLKLECWLSLGINLESWLSQANYVFSRLHMTSNFEEYGFLFLCPQKDFQTGPSSFCWPDCPAYWSLDPFGVERLSVEEATDVGFPSLEFTTKIWGHSWDNSVYAGIREFHREKGFDPESQGVARHLGRPLYYPFNETDAPFAHVNEEEGCYFGEADEDQTDVEEGDYLANADDEEDDQMDLEKKDEDQMDLSW
ncbi:hypothetical protein B0H19DRAFT_1232577 [Mycena capillaripes]|nr:hypothetical protein B0H19DRAFT_1232577 [Mycena capillaripes]